MEQQSKQKQNKVMSHSNWPHVLLYDLAHKQCNGVIKRWLHSLMSESKGRFLVKNIWLSMIFDHCTNPVFSILKKKIGLPENSLPPPPHPHLSDNISILSYPLFLKWASCVSPLLHLHGSTHQKSQPEVSCTYRENKHNFVLICSLVSK